MDMLHPIYSEVNTIIGSNQHYSMCGRFMFGKFGYLGSRYYKSNMLLNPRTGA